MCSRSKSSLGVVLILLIMVSPAVAWDTNDWDFLDTIQQANFRAFRDTKVGPYQLTCDAIIYDNPYNFGPITSIAGIGFKLASMCVGHYRGWVSYEEAYGEVLRLLQAFGNELSSDPNVFPRVNGWTYHFYNNGDGTMNPKDGLSLLDHMLFIGGVIVAGEYFKGTEAGETALRLYSETQWDSTGSGDNDYTHWGYAENLLAIIEAADAPQHNKHATASNMWATVTAGVPYHLPLYYWQFPHCYVDFRFRWDPRGRNHENIARDTILHQRQWCNDRFWDWKLSGGWECATYSNATFGLSACGSSTGYRILDAIDEWSCDSGSLMPISIPPCMIYAGTETMATLKYLFEEYYIKGWTPPRIPIWSHVFGLPNCYNVGSPSGGGGSYYNGWNADIDYGPNVLLLENYRLGTTWRYFMQNPCIAAAMDTVGFGPPQNVYHADFTNAGNQFGGTIGHWENDGTPVSASYEWTPYCNPWVGGHSVRFVADNNHEGGWIDLGGRDMRGKAQVSFWVQGHTGAERIDVGLKDTFGRENKVHLQDFAGGVMPTNWTHVKIPLEAFAITTVISNDIWPGNLPLISFEFTNSAGGGLDIDYMAFEPDTIPPTAPTSRMDIAHFRGYPRARWGETYRDRDLVGYYLWRRTDPTGAFVKAATRAAPAHSTTADDTSFAGAPGQWVEYRVQAADNAEPPNSSAPGPAKSFICLGGGRTDVDWNNGFNPNVFGGTNDGYWGGGGPQVFDFAQDVMPWGATAWVRRSSVSAPSSGHYVDMADGDAGDSWALAFYIRGAAGGEVIQVGLKDGDAHEVKVNVADYADGGTIATNWSRAIVPFSEFTNVNVTSLDNISFTHAASGTVYVGDLGFLLGQRPLLVNSRWQEAERWVACTGTQVRDFKSAASCREVLGEGWGGGSGSYAEYACFTDRPLTDQVVRLRYACWDGDGRVLQVSWNGAFVGTLTCTNTGGWGDQESHFSWAECALPPLTAGWHRLVLTVAGADSSVNLDGFSVTEARPYFRECEDYDAQTGSSNRDWKAGASAGEVLGSSWGLATNSEALYTNMGERAITSAWFHLWYALDASSGRVVDVYVDGGWKARLPCAGTAGWGGRACEFDRASARIGALAPGPHAVRLAVPNGYAAINLDCFCISEDGPEGGGCDADGDGLSDRQEALTGTGAGAADTDGDGLADGDELQSGAYGQVTDPLKADTDGDTQDDGDEVVAGTDPNDAGLFFQCSDISNADSPMVGKILRWVSATGRQYSVHAVTDLSAGGFAPLTTGLPATPPENAWTDTVSGSGAAGYYRIGVRKP